MIFQKPLRFFINKISNKFSNPWARISTSNFLIRRTQMYVHNVFTCNKRGKDILFIHSKSEKRAQHERRLAAAYVCNNNFHENDMKMLIYNIFINNNTRRRTPQIAHFLKISVSKFNVQWQWYIIYTQYYGC